MLDVHKVFGEKNQFPCFRRFQYWIERSKMFNLKIDRRASFTVKSTFPNTVITFEAIRICISRDEISISFVYNLLYSFHLFLSFFPLLPKSLFLCLLFSLVSLTVSVCLFLLSFRLLYCLLSFYFLYLGYFFIFRLLELGM